MFTDANEATLNLLFGLFRFSVDADLGSAICCVVIVHKFTLRHFQEFTDWRDISSLLIDLICDHNVVVRV